MPRGGTQVGASFWEREPRTFKDFPYQVKVFEGSVAEREQQLVGPWTEGASRAAVVNYEATWRMEEALARFVKGGPIIADESHRIKTPRAQQSKAMGRLGGWRPTVSCSPARRLRRPARPLESVPVSDPSSFHALLCLRNRYAIMGGYGNYQVVGYKNLAELVEKAHRTRSASPAECLDLAGGSHQHSSVSGPEGQHSVPGNRGGGHRPAVQWCHGLGRKCPHRASRLQRWRRLGHHR